MVNDIIQWAGFLLAMSVSVALPPALWVFLWRRRESRNLARDTKIQDRIDRLESEIDALTTDVARMRETQEFLTKVIAKPAQDSGAARVESPPLR
jgi:hypothetical protein